MRKFRDKQVLEVSWHSGTYKPRMIEDLAQVCHVALYVELLQIIPGNCKIMMRSTKIN